ncbi:hypothetical protein Tco_0975446 [Tanacetum coccineum]|uniref:Aminoacyl-tRNA synthetase, class 1a, anticodon-binding n=1 Tax=Tanacetum coccineum TaxID=301880 RepID=A0ABQ5EED5_9ASTR
MAALRYRDEHNKVGYLQKPKASDDYHQVLDFLRASHIRSPELGPPTILATIDETPDTITKDSVRSQLQLTDDGGIDDLPIADIYSGMDNLISLAVALICLSDRRKFNWSSYIFKGMGQPMLLLAIMLSQAQAGEGAGVTAQAVPPPIPETIPETRPKPDQPQDHLSTPPRQQTSDPIAPVFEHGQSSDPNIASFSRAHDPDDEPFTSTNVEDEPLGGSFHASPPRSTQTPPTGHTSGGAEDLITLTALSSVVSTLVQKVNSLETELKAHKKLFKDVVGKLVKKVKAMEAKLKPKKRKVVVSDSDQDEGGEQTVDLDALIALANAAVTVDSNIPPGGPSNDPAASSHIPSGVPTDGDFAPAHSTSPSRDPFKGKGVAEPSSPVSKRTKKQLADERLSEIEAARLEALERERFEKEKAEIARQDEIYAKQLEQEEEMSASQRETRQAKVLSSAKHYSDADWIDIMAQVHANACLSSELLGADVNDDNFAERMVALINQRKRAFAEQTAKAKRDRPMTPAQQREYMRVFVKNQSTTIYSTGWSMKYVKSLADEQLIAEFEKIRMASTKAPIPSVPDVPQPKVVSSSKSSSTRRKSLGRIRISKPELDLDADDKTFIKVVSDEDSEDEAPILWSTFAGWEYYENHPVTGARLMLWGDLQVLMDSQEGGKGSSIWHHQSLWQISCWRLYTLSNVHVLETISGEVLYMFVDVSYPLSVKLMERMLKHKLEIAKDVVGNDMTTAEQLIRFIKNQLAAAQVSPA